jgi:hypothetical protein
MMLSTSTIGFTVTDRHSNLRPRSADPLIPRSSLALSGAFDGVHPDDALPQERMRDAGRGRGRGRPSECRGATRPLFHAAPSPD